MRKSASLTGSPGRSPLFSASSKLATFGITAALVVTPMFAVAPAYADGIPASDVAQQGDAASSTSADVAAPSPSDSVGVVPDVEDPATSDPIILNPVTIDPIVVDAAAASAVAPDPAAGDVMAAETAAPFALVTPDNGSTVDSTTPTYSGTGTPGDTITIVYSGQERDTYTAGETVVDENGNWSVVTDFSRLNGGDTEVRTLTTTSGSVSDGFFTNITFPEAPVAVTPFTVATPSNGETRSDFLNLVPYTGTGGPGNTITIEYFGNGGALATAGSATVQPDGTYRVLTNFENLAPGATFVQSFVEQFTPEGTSAARDISVSFNFADAPVATFPFTITSPENGATVDSVTPTYSGTGTPGNTVTITYSGQNL